MAVDRPAADRPLGIDLPGDVRLDVERLERGLLRLEPSWKVRRPLRGQSIRDVETEAPGVVAGRRVIVDEGVGHPRGRSHGVELSVRRILAEASIERDRGDAATHAPPVE